MHKHDTVFAYSGACYLGNPKLDYSKVPHFCPVFHPTKRATKSVTVIVVVCVLTFAMLLP